MDQILFYLFGSHRFQPRAESALSQMLAAETPRTKTLFPERTRDGQPGCQPEQNGQCEEDAPPRTGPQES